MWQYDAPTYYGNTAGGYLVSDTNDHIAVKRSMTYVAKWGQIELLTYEMLMMTLLICFLGKELS